jgi:hypothetical protein
LAGFDEGGALLSTDDRACDKTEAAAAFDSNITTV